MYLSHTAEQKGTDARSRSGLFELLDNTCRGSQKEGAKMDNMDTGLDISAHSPLPPLNALTQFPWAITLDRPGASQLYHQTTEVPPLPPGLAQRLLTESWRLL